MKFADIVSRVERVRLVLGMNKSRFAGAFGMKAQTYNNFVGALGTKPSVELLYGIVDRFGANPHWLLTGQGPMFRDEFQETGPSAGALTPGAFSADHTNGGAPALDAFTARSALSHASQLLSAMDGLIDSSRPARAALLERITRVLARYLAQQPDEARTELTALLERIERRLADWPPVN